MHLTEIILQAYPQRAMTIDTLRHEDILEFGSNTWEIIYPHGNKRCILKKTIGTPVVRHDYNEVSMFVEGDHTEEDIEKCRSCYVASLDCSITEAEVKLKALKDEKAMWEAK